MGLNVVKTYVYRHPELTLPWFTQGADPVRAKKRFEDAWCVRVGHGVLEEVDGSFFDGEVKDHGRYEQDNLCPNDLGGHMMAEDKRPERREFATGRGKPVACMLCSSTGWTDMAVVF